MMRPTRGAVKGGALASPREPLRAGRDGRSFLSRRGGCYTAPVTDALDRLLDSQHPTPELLGELGPLRALCEVLLGGAAPRESLLNLRKILVAAGATTPVPVAGLWPEEPEAVRALASVLSSGPELTRWLARRPARLSILADPRLAQPVPADELRRQVAERLAGIADPSAFAEELTAYRNDHYLRLAAGEFGLSSLEQVGRGLSDLADACLEEATRFALSRLAEAHGPPLREDLAPGMSCGLAALAMGKYGAQELNFCSDIDVVFIYATDEGHAGELSLHEFFTKVIQLVTRLLSEPNAEGQSFRVDLRLRPEGSRGPLCNSLAGAESYYETWGGPYDRLAWLKARPAAGDLELGAAMVLLLSPFVFPRSTRPEVIEEIQALNRRIKAEHAGAAAGGWNVKLGGGGIREVEFFVQALQLLHAGKQPALRERASLRALDKLLFAGLISEHEHRTLGECYELWRHIEHRLQLHEGRQTHLLPDRGPLRERVARHLGFDLERFDAELGERRGLVSAIYATLGAGEVADDEARLAPVLDVDLPETAARALLAEAGFGQTERALEQIQLLASKPWGPLARAGTAAPKLALPLLAELARSPDADAALLHLTELALRVGPHQGLWSLLAERRPLLRLLCSLFGSSDYLARHFIRHPELLDQLVAERGGGPLRAREVLRAELEGRLGELDAEDIEARLELLARFRSEEVLRVGLHDIAGDLSQEQVWEQLSDIADVILGELYPRVLADTEARYGTPRGEGGVSASLAVLALGKLGSRELTYASDLDLIFVYSSGGSTDGARSVDNGEFFARVVQRLIRALATTIEDGTGLYQVDTRLRPSGKQGTLVTSFAAFQDYHRSAQTWERQVLLKVRPVGGDLELGARVSDWIQAFLFGEAPTDTALRGDIHRLRTRMEKELAGEGGDFYNLKLGRGGLLEVDFVAQFLQLLHGARCPSLRVKGTLDALAALEREGLLARLDAATLIEGYRFLRRIESRLRIVRDRSAESLPASADGLEVMARRLGYRRQRERSAGEQLLGDYRLQTEAIRAVYGRVLGAE